MQKLTVCNAGQGLMARCQCAEEREQIECAKKITFNASNENRTCLLNLIASTSIKTNTQQQRRRCDVLIRHTNILVSLQTWELNSTRAAVVSAIKP